MKRTQQCGKCWDTYDPDTNSVTCPHVGFPRDVTCGLHARKNCGNPECEKELAAKMAVFPLALTGPKRKAG